MKKTFLTKLLSIAATLLLWFPILKTLIISIGLSIIYREFVFNYYVAAESAIFTLAGAGLLLWAAIRVRVMVKPVVWTLISMIMMFSVNQAIVMISERARGWVLIVYTLLSIILAVISIRLVWKVNNPD